MQSSAVSILSKSRLASIPHRYFSSTSALLNSPPSPAARKLKHTRRREWTWVALSGGVATVGAWYLFTTRQTSNNSSSQGRRVFSSLVSPAPVSFSIHLRSATGGAETKVIQALTPAQVARRLSANEATTIVDREACLVSRYDTNVVASNDPVEDRHAQAIVQRDTEVKGAKVGGKPDELGDLAFFAVMDGHAGWNTSDFLSKQLIAAVATELDSVFRATGPYASLAASKAALPFKAWRALFGNSALPGVHSDAALDADPEIVAKALEKAFVRLDQHITQTPVRLLERYQELVGNATLTSDEELGTKDAQQTGIRSLSTLASSLLPQSTTPIPSSASAASSAQHDVESPAALRRAGYEALLPALSGSCALLTYVDSARGDVYVACTGDSRAVAGWYDPASHKWSVEQLSEDQTGRSPAELKRMRAEHPTSESETVIMRGRVLGGLEPTRAFGDARYKWSRELQEQLTATLLPGGKKAARPPPRGLQTPPYVTARPEVTWRCTNTSVGANQGKELRWIVMATDGLWDMLPTSEVGALVSAHLDGARGDFSAAELKAHIESGFFPSSFAPLSSPSSAAPSNKQSAAGNNPTREREHPLSKGTEAQYCFEDSNLATHLIKNALGGAKRDRVAGLLAITSPDARRFRDDITVNVILFDPKQAQNKSTSTSTSTSTQSTGTQAPIQAEL